MVYVGAHVGARVCTDAIECVLQLQSEGGEGNVLRHGQDGDSGQVGGWVSCIPLTVGGVEGQVACCKGRGGCSYWIFNTAQNICKTT